jgi:DNA-binding PadR family transcriptional regulator
MAKSGLPTNPLALAVLVLLFERPMHPYEMAATMRARRKEQSFKLRYGSLYTVIEQLQREGMIAPRETVREGRRPERTIYEATPAGLDRMRDWLRELLGTPVKEYPRFEGALSLLPAVPPDEATALLEGRVQKLGVIAEELRAGIDLAHNKLGVESLYLVESEYRLEMLEAERDFVARLLRRIKEDADYVRTWKGFHATRSQSESPGGSDVT